MDRWEIEDYIRNRAEEKYKSYKKQSPSYIESMVNLLRGEVIGDQSLKTDDEIKKYIDSNINRFKNN